MEKARKKLEYFWMYYKWHVILPAAFLMIAAGIIYSFLGEEEMLLNVYLINTGTRLGAAEEIAADFKKESRIGDGKVLLDATLSIDTQDFNENAYTGSLEKITTEVFAHDLDVIIAPMDVVVYYGERGAVDEAAARSLEGSRWEEALGMEEPLYICILKNSGRKEMAEEFISYMLQNQRP